MTDFPTWDFAIDFTGIQSASLVAGVDPAQYEIAREKVAPVLDRISRGYELARGYYRDVYMADTSDLDPNLLNEALESIDMRRKLGQVTNRAEEVRFAEWLLEDASEFERQRFSRTQLVDWLDAIGLTSVYSFSPSVPMAESAKPDGTLNSKVHSTLLRLVIGMAIKGYRHDPTASKSAAPKEIAGDLAELGMTITDDTVRKYLKQAADTVLPTNWRQP